MSYYDDDSEERSGLTLGDIGRALKGADQVAFGRLMTKALNALDADNGGIISQLKEENVEIKQRIATLSGDLISRNTALVDARTRIAVLDAAIAELRLTLGATDSERAATLLAENDRLKATVAIQRQIVAGYERETGIASADITRAGGGPAEARKAMN